MSWILCTQTSELPISFAVLTAAQQDQSWSMRWFLVQPIALSFLFFFFFLALDLYLLSFPNTKGENIWRDNDTVLRITELIELMSGNWIALQNSVLILSTTAFTPVSLILLDSIKQRDVDPHLNLVPVNWTKSHSVPRERSGQIRAMREWESSTGKTRKAK